MVYGYIYSIQNSVNNKRYVGQTTQNPDKRKRKHFETLRKNKHDNLHLQNSFNKYGESVFVFTTLNYATNRETLDKLEKKYINHYDCLNRDKGYNLREGGLNGKFSPEIYQKISNAITGEKNPNYGRKGKLSPRFGQKHSLETRKKMSESQRRRYKEHPYPSFKNGKKISKLKRNRGLFGFTGNHLHKRDNPELNCWESRIFYKNHRKTLGYFMDPLSCQIIYELVFDAMYNL